MNEPEPADVTWRTSSYSGNGGNCVEVAWRTSSHSGNGGDCVEVGQRDGEVLLRDTKDRPGGILTVSRARWQEFLDGLR